MNTFKFDEEFDFEEFKKQALEKVRQGQPVTGKNGVLMPLIKDFFESALEGEMDSHLSQEVTNNRRNGKSRKTVKCESGAFELETPRDRDASFDPQIIKKRQTTVSDALEEKIIALYALGMSYRDISAHLAEMYGLEISAGALSAVTDKIIPRIKEWQSRPLESVYPFVWMDAIHYKTKEDARVVARAVYTILGVDQRGRKDVLGIYISEAEGANFWLGVLTDLQNRGVRDILIACIDGLRGFPEAINTVFPDTEIQLCVVHQIRNSLKYIASKDQKAFMKDLKQVYRATNKDLAETKLLELEEVWGKKYPIVIASWQKNWANLSAYFRYPQEIRRIIYTTNIIEGVHRQFRKLTKTKGAFTSENALLKLLYLGIQRISQKWTAPLQNWARTVSQLAIFFKGRLDLDLSF
jgi:transposase-like protein